MEIIDKHFQRIPSGQKAFILLIGACYTLIAIVAYLTNMATLFESLIFFTIGLIYTELLKFRYRIETLESKRKK